MHEAVASPARPDIENAVLLIQATLVDIHGQRLLDRPKVEDVLLDLLTLLVPALPDYPEE